jgi:transposase
LDSLILPQVNADAMSMFLDEVAIRHADDFVLMVMDKAGWHKANDLRVPENVRPTFLPPYSPELNPVEHIWDEVREKWFSNRVFRCIDAVEYLLVDALSTLENQPTRVAGLTGFDWIISLILNAN